MSSPGPFRTRERSPQAAPEPDVARAARGDPAAFESIVRRFDPSLRALATRVLGRRWSEDALQDAYLKAFRALPRFDAAEGSLHGWLATIVYRACIDEVRRSNADRRAPGGFRDDLIAPERVDMDADMDNRRALETALARLTEPDRAALVLVDALGFDYDTAARVLDLPRGTLASRLNRARRVARKALSTVFEEEAR